MNLKCIWTAALFLLICTFVSDESLAAEGGAAPYALLYQSLERGNKISEFELLIPVQRIASKLPGVTPDRIEVEIRARQGTIAVPIAANGVAEFPLTPELLAENPLVYSNQPKGTLSVSVSIEVAKPKTLQWPYQQALAAMTQSEAALAKLEGLNGAYIAGLEVYFEDSQAQVSIRSSKRDELLLPDALSTVFIRRDPMLEKDAVVAFSSMPVRIVPLVRR
jgi:hypothetical protein